VTGQRVALYLRVSTRDQSVLPQFEALRNLATLRGLRIVKVYRERRSSVLDRPEWRRLMADAAMNRFDVAAVWALDRAGRKLTEVVSHVEKLTARGVGFVSARDGLIDTTTASGRLILGVMAACAQFERERLIERTREALALRKRQGVKLGRRAIPVDLPAVQARLAAGESVAAVARSLLIPRPSGPPRPLSERTLRRLLRAG